MLTSTLPHLLKAMENVPIGGQQAKAALFGSSGEVRTVLFTRLIEHAKTLPPEQKDHHAIVNTLSALVPFLEADFRDSLLYDLCLYLIDNLIGESTTDSVSYYHRLMTTGGRTKVDKYIFKKGISDWYGPNRTITSNQARLFSTILYQYITRQEILEYELTDIQKTNLAWIRQLLIINGFVNAIEDNKGSILFEQKVKEFYISLNFTDSVIGKKNEDSKIKQALLIYVAKILPGLPRIRIDSGVRYIEGLVRPPRINPLRTKEVIEKEALILLMKMYGRSREAKKLLEKRVDITSGLTNEDQKLRGLAIGLALHNPE